MNPLPNESSAYFGPYTLSSANEGCQRDLQFSFEAIVFFLIEKTSASD